MSWRASSSIAPSLAAAELGSAEPHRLYEARPEPCNSNSTVCPTGAVIFVQSHNLHPLRAQLD